MTRPSRIRIIHVALILFAAALIAQLAKVQIVQRKHWAELGRKQHYLSDTVPSARGEILDASGETLVESRELTHIAIAPQQVRDTARLLAALKQTGISDSAAKSIFRPGRKWVDLPQLFNSQDVERILGMRGVVTTPVMRRVYAASPGIQRIVGRLDGNGRALDGIESALDSTLRGDSARSSVARDKRGNPIGSPDDAADIPRGGATVVLTINRALQDICERELGIAVDSLHASGGDIVVMNPKNGDILALASRRADPGAFANTSITEPFEPGSTLKPFTAAALLQRKLATPDEIIDTYNGKFEIDGRTITDTHPAVRLSLADVIKFSSNRASCGSGSG
jgi:Cell division protein FtsI/penicillin-binding protein 2